MMLEEQPSGEWCVLLYLLLGASRKIRSCDVPLRCPRHILRQEDLHGVNAILPVVG